MVIKEFKILHRISIRFIESSKMYVRHPKLNDNVSKKRTISYNKRQTLFLNVRI